MEFDEPWAQPPGRVHAGNGGGVAPEAFRRALRRHAAGVAVITASLDGRPAGLTVTSLVSVSLQPPLVSFAITTDSSAYPTFAACPTFVVNLLAAEQERIAVRFATRGIDRFAAPTRWAPLPTGEPVLLDAPAYLRCEVLQRVPAGDHHLVIGHVVATVTHRGHAPLVYHEGRYTGLRLPRGWLRRRR